MQAFYYVSLLFLPYKYSVFLFKWKCSHCTDRGVTKSSISSRAFVCNFRIVATTAYPVFSCLVVIPVCRLKQSVEDIT
jgi:hypothetical protein